MTRNPHIPNHGRGAAATVKSKALAAAMRHEQPVAPRRARFAVIASSILLMAGVLSVRPAQAEDENGVCSTSANLSRDEKQACLVAMTFCMFSGVGQADSRGAHRACVDRLMRKAGNKSLRGSESSRETLSETREQSNRAFNACLTSPTIDTCSEAIRSEGLSARERSRAYAWRALAREENDNADSNGLAIPDCEQAISLDPNDGLAFLVRGLVYSSRLVQHVRDQQLFSQAIWDLGRAIALGLPEATRPMAYQVRAEVYQAGAFVNSRDPRSQSDYYRKSLGDYSEAITLSPHDANLYSKRAFIEDKLGDAKASYDDVRTAKGIDPNVKTYLDYAAKN